MKERQEWPFPTLLAPEPLLVNTCQPTVQCSAPRGWQPWVGWALSLPQLVLPSPPPRILCLAWRKALLSSAGPHPEHLEHLCRVCGLQFPLPCLGAGTEGCIVEVRPFLFLASRSPQDFSRAQILAFLKAILWLSSFWDSQNAH